MKMEFSGGNGSELKSFNRYFCEKVNNFYNFPTQILNKNRLVFANAKAEFTSLVLAESGKNLMLS